MKNNNTLPGHRITPAPGWPRPAARPAAPEVRKDPDGTIDEILASNVRHFHLEKLSNNGICIILQDQAGENYYIDFYSNGHIKINMEKR